LWPPARPGETLPVRRNRPDHFDMQDGLIRKAAATARIVCEEVFKFSL
jgi:hypothetical protein